MRVGSLFSGGGMGDFGLMMAGMEIAWQVENDEHCRRILELRWPGLPRWGDIRTVDPADLPPVDLISGGFPCQPVSVAGKRRGDQDDRWLWPEMLRIIQGVRPTWCLCENVPGLVNLGLDGVLSDLEGAGYACQPFIIPAAAVDAPHRRDRVWVVAHAGQFSKRTEIIGSDSERQNSEEAGVRTASRYGSSDGGEDVAHTESIRRSPRRAECQGQQWETALVGDGPQDATHATDPGIEGVREWKDSVHRGYWATEPGVCGISHGTPNRMVRLKLLGNGQVAPLVAEIGRMIMRAHATRSLRD